MNPAYWSYTWRMRKFRVNHLSFCNSAAWTLFQLLLLAAEAKGILCIKHGPHTHFSPLGVCHMLLLSHMQLQQWEEHFCWICFDWRCRCGWSPVKKLWENDQWCSSGVDDGDDKDSIITCSFLSCGHLRDSINPFPVQKITICFPSMCCQFQRGTWGIRDRNCHYGSVCTFVIKGQF